MDINLHTTTANQFSHYSDSSVKVNGIEYFSNILVDNYSVSQLNYGKLNDINIEFINSLIAKKPDLIIFGTANEIIYPDKSIISLIHQNRIGVECMQIQALCRTFNFLISEDRQVSGLLFF
jgi:uncharacterized protein